MTTRIRTIAQALTIVGVPAIALYTSVLLLVLVVGCGSSSPTASSSSDAPTAAKEQAVESNDVELLVKSFSQSLTVLALQTSGTGSDDSTIAGYVEEMKAGLFAAYADLAPDTEASVLGGIRSDIDNLTATFLDAVADDPERAGEARDRLARQLTESMT